MSKPVVRSIKASPEVWASVEVAALAAGESTHAFCVRVISEASGYQPADKGQAAVVRPPPAPKRPDAVAKAKDVLAEAEAKAAHLAEPRPFSRPHMLKGGALRIYNERQASKP
jgi:hypothetical protein